MIVLECEQGSVAWKEARMGIPTASEFKRIITPTGKLSAQRDGYLAELIVEFVTGEPYSDFESDEMKAGRIMEPEAVAHYALVRDATPEKVGFCYKDATKAVGASPDALVGDDGLLEAKCPQLKTLVLWEHRGILPADHVTQVQGQLWVTGRDWCDFLAYSAIFPPLLVRAYPDPKMHAAFDSHLPTFLEELEAAKERQRARGSVIADRRDSEGYPF